MSNSPLAISQPLDWALLAAAVFVILSATVLLMRTGSVAGPARALPGEPAGPLLGLTILAVSIWTLVPGILAASLESGENVATTSPATQQTIRLPPAQTVGVSIISAIIVSAFLLLGNLLVRPGGLTRMGFVPRMLPRGIVIGVATAILALPLAFLAVMITTRLWDWMKLQHPGSHEMLQILGKADNPLLRGLIYVSAIVVSPLFEELLFRGHVQTAMVQLFHSTIEWKRSILRAAGTSSSSAYEPAARWIAILATSVLFALVHGALWMMPPIFVLSVCLGYAYERTANLWAPITIHMMFNATNIILFVHLSSR